MQAAILDAYGEPECLRLREAPDPAPGPGEVLVRVRACALNRRDIWVRRGLRERKLPHILGTDIAGEVAALGGGVRDPGPGARVLVQPTLSCGRCDFCRAGQDNACPELRILGGAVDGGYAQLIAVPARNIFPMPEGLSSTQAASIPVVFLTAWHLLVTRARARPGETVLVLGGSSGLGTAAIQVARLCGARVIATAGSEAKRQRCLALGAERVLDHRAGGLSEAVRRLTDGRGAEVVFEHIGQATWGESLKSLSRGGRLTVCGGTTGADVTLPLAPFWTQNQTVHGGLIGSAGEFQAVLRHFASLRLRPVVDRVFPLAEAVQAHRHLEAGEHFGKVVLEIP